MSLPVNGAYFDPNNRQPFPEEPSLEDVIRQALRQHEMGLHVCMPAAVVAASSPYRVDVQPLFQARYFAQKKPTTLPLIADVPVSMPTGQSWAVKFPQPQRGDTGWLIFADRSLETWRAGDGGPADPKDSRAHDITDAIFIPGLQVDSAAAADTATAGGAATDLVVRNGLATLRVAQAGKFQITNGAVELVAAVKAVAESAATVATSALPVPDPTGATAARLAAAAEQLQLLAQALGRLAG